MIVLQQIQINQPCHASWDAMTGNAQARFCAGCQKTVHDLSQMKTEDAQTLLSQSGAKICVRFTRNTDGQIKTISHETKPAAKKQLRKPKKIVKPTTVKPRTLPHPTPMMGLVAMPPPIPEHTMGKPSVTSIPSDK